MPLFAAVLVSFIPAFFFASIIYWIDRYEKEPKRLLLGTFIWGAVVAAGGSYIFNTLFGLTVFLATGDELLADTTTGSISAPLVEESLKAFAVLIIFWWYRSEFDTVLDGIVYAGIAALGFAATENVLYIYEYGYLEEGWFGFWSVFFIRVILGPWGHPFYTAFTGIGLALSRLNKNILIIYGAPVLGWLISVFTHSLHNSLAAFTGNIILVFLSDWLGWIFMSFIIWWAIQSEKKWISKQLREEIQNGLLDQKQYQIVTSAWKRSGANMNGLFSGGYRKSRRFYQLLTELAYKKQQLERVGENKSNSLTMIEDLRRKIRQITG